MRPPAIAVAIRGQSVGVSDPIGVFVDRRLELGKFLLVRVEAHGSWACSSPNLALTIHVHCSRRGGGAGHTVGHGKHLDLFGAGIDFGQSSLATFDACAHIEPEDSLPIPGEPVTIRGHTVQSGDLECL